ncbi:MAG: ATP-binding cassette domain-containing protein [Coriobacteriia bacterium]|nr:ATP-binding cassette domain-containing protein [Coriobacteriia bacterium]
MIVFDDVTYRYAPSSAPALEGISLTLAPGEFVALVGANGSGKSTLARLCDGLALPSAGSVAVDGLDTLDGPSSLRVRSVVGMVFQDPDDQIVGTVVEEDCAFGPENLGVPSEEIRVRVDESLAAVGLTGLERREPHLLSEGQKQRLAVAGALAMRPRYLVLDEPSAMLDPAGRRAVLAIVERLAHEDGHGVLLISHDAVGVARADRVIGLVQGRVVYDGTPVGLLADATLLETLGLAMPPAGVLAACLRESGVAVPPDAVEPESVVAALWP